MIDHTMKYWLTAGFTLISGAIANLYRKVKSERELSEKKLTAVELGIQALLRDKIIAEYDKYNRETGLGYYPIYKRHNLENMHKQYEALGENGVIDDLYHKLLKLPVALPKGE